jgi:hypothetical protein
MRFPAFLKRIDKTETVWTPNVLNHHFAVQIMCFVFEGLLAGLNPNNFVSHPQIETRLIQYHDTSPVIILRRFEEHEQFI